MSDKQIHFIQDKINKIEAKISELEYQKIKYLEVMRRLE